MEDMWNEAYLLIEAKRKSEERIKEAKRVKELLQAEHDAASCFIHTDI